MTDIVITPASVLPGSGATVKQGTAGATITQGQVLYMIEATKRLGLADNNSATAEVRRPVGIALNAAANGQPIAYQTAGPITVGGTLVANTAYYLSDAPGGIAPVADLAPGEYPALLGMSTSTTVLNIDIQFPGGAL